MVTPYRRKITARGQFPVWRFVLARRISWFASRYHCTFRRRITKKLLTLSFFFQPRQCGWQLTLTWGMDWQLVFHSLPLCMSLLKDASTEQVGNIEQSPLFFPLVTRGQFSNDWKRCNREFLRRPLATVYSLLYFAVKANPHTLYFAVLVAKSNVSATVVSSCIFIVYCSKKAARTIACISIVHREQ